MATRNVNRLMRSRSSKSTTQVQRKSALAEDDDPELENSSKKRKEIRRDVVESCQQCNRNDKGRLVKCRRCQSMNTNDQNNAGDEMDTNNGEEDESVPGTVESSRKTRKMEKSVSSRKLRDDEQISCHQCRMEKELLVVCNKCSNKFCFVCMTKWYPYVSGEELVKACPLCRNNCNCKACLLGFTLKDMQQGYSCSQPDKIKYSEQVLQQVLPLVTLLNEEQLIEKEIEAKLKGVSISGLQLQDAGWEVDADIFCDNCGSYFLDFYRSCACGYVLCLVCCQGMRDGQLGGSISCPPNNIGGCNDGILELKRIMPANWIDNLLEKGHGLYKIINNPQTSTESNASCLYSLNAKDIEPEHKQRFQFHWARGEPIIVEDALSTSSGLSWDPMVLWRACNRSQGYEVNAINCRDWSEVNVSLNDFCRRYALGQSKRQGMPLVLKLEDWQPPFLSQGEWWSRHFVELINMLPFKDYTHPYDGCLNLAAKLPDLSFKPDMGPKMDIAYGGEEELEHGGSVTKLHFDKSDTVNVLTHTKHRVHTSKRPNKTKMLKQNHGALASEAGPETDEGQQYAVDPMEGSALWDVFQRQDVSKLEAYLRKNSAEFRHINEQVSHPIHDRTIYLNTKHKRKLKEEFGIEPWTFKQKLGDAVFVPAGCPYQVRNLMFNTKVKLNFVSPESLNECIRLQNKLRLLPNNHRAQQQKLNIGKMMIYALEHAVAELSGGEASNGDQFAKAPEILNGGGMNHTNGWICDSESDNSHHAAAVEERDTDTSAEWRGNAVGQTEKEILEAVECNYPDTFQRVEIPSKPLWLSILKELHLFITRFLETSVGALSEDQLNTLETDLNVFERLGFDLSWARKRIDMVRNLKFGNDTWRVELKILEESLACSHKEVEELTQRLETVRLEYANARDARDNKVAEVKQRFGCEYENVLHRNLGFGILPGY